MTKPDGEKSQGASREYLRSLFQKVLSEPREEPYGYVLIGRYDGDNFFMRVTGGSKTWCEERMRLAEVSEDELWLDLMIIPVNDFLSPM